MPSVQAQLRESGRTRREQDHGAFVSLKAPRDPLTAAIQPVHWVMLTPPNFLSIELVSQLLNTALSCFLHSSGDIASLVFPRGFGFVPMVAHAGSSLCLTAANMSFVPAAPGTSNKPVFFGPTVLQNFSIVLCANFCVTEGAVAHSIPPLLLHSR